MTSLTERLLSGALMIATGGFAIQAMAQQTDNKGNVSPTNKIVIGENNYAPYVDAKGNIYAPTNQIEFDDTFVDAKGNIYAPTNVIEHTPFNFAKYAKMLLHYR